MAALTNTYVDPSIAANSGTGTSGDPYGDLQYALDTMAQDATNGDQLNVKAGTAEVLTGALSFAGYGTPTEYAPLVIKGYTSTANDGGKGVISGNGGAIIAATSPQWIRYIDLTFQSGGSSTILALPMNTVVMKCKIDNTSGKGISSSATLVTVMECEITDCDVGIEFTNGSCAILNNYFKFGSNRNFTYAINITNNGTYVVARNIISCGTSGNGIYIQGQNDRIFNNSIFAAGSTGTGIYGQYAAYTLGLLLFNNVIEGFSGAGGKGFDLITTSIPLYRYAKNAAYNNTTNFANVGDGGIVEDDDNEVLSASPFAKSGSDTFANRYVYFAPVDTGNIHGGALQ